MPTYCGNNNSNPRLIHNGGDHIIGSRHQCLKKGIGLGIHMPIDPSYNGPYNPIDQRKFYCGDNAMLPPGYDAFGTLQQCFTKGVGVGRRKIALGVIPNPNPIPIPHLAFNPIVNGDTGFKKYIYIYIVSIAIFITALLSIKPDFIKKKDDKDEIDWNIFFYYLALFIIVMTLFLYIIYKYNN